MLALYLDLCLLACCIVLHLYQSRACDNEWVIVVPGVQQTCVNQAQVLSTPKHLFYFRDVIPTLKNQTLKRLGTVKTRFYIVEMFKVCSDKAHIGCSTSAIARPGQTNASRFARQHLKIYKWNILGKNKKQTIMNHAVVVLCRLM